MPLVVRASLMTFWVSLGFVCCLVCVHQRSFQISTYRLSSLMQPERILGSVLPPTNAPAGEASLCVHCGVLGQTSL